MALYGMRAERYADPRDRRRARLLEYVEAWRETGWTRWVEYLHAVFRDAFTSPGHGAAVYRRAMQISRQLETHHEEAKQDELFHEVDVIAARLQNQLENATHQQIERYAWASRRAPVPFALVNPIPDEVSLAISILGIVVTGVAVYYGTRAANPPAPVVVAPATPGTQPSMILTQGASYSFVLSAPSDPTSWLQQAGATIAGVVVQAAGTTQPTWSGTFTWNGANGANLPTPPGTQWVTVTPLAPLVAPGASAGSSSSSPSPSPSPSPCPPGTILMPNGQCSHPPSPVSNPNSNTSTVTSGGGAIVGP